MKNYKKNPVTEDSLIELFNYFGRFQGRTSPGHDKGHEYRDALVAIYNYSNIKDKAAYQSDAMAGLISGIFHDIGVVIVPRYSDKNYGAGHSEAGAFFFYKHGQKLLGENLCKLVGYAIAAHANYEHPIKVVVPEGYMKLPYWDGINKKDNKLLGIAPTLARLSDRTDIHSVAQPIRNIIATAYTYFSGFTGSYMSPQKEWVKSGLESMVNICLPINDSGDRKHPTTMQECLGYARSFDNPYYSKYDSYFPGYTEMLQQRARQVIQMDEKMNEQDLDEGKNHDFTDGLVKARKLFYKISKSNPEKFEIAWNGFQSVWENKDIMTDDYKRRWLRGFEFLERAYQEMIEDYKLKLSNSEFPNLTSKIIGELMQEN